MADTTRRFIGVPSFDPVTGTAARGTPGAVSQFTPASAFPSGPLAPNVQGLFQQATLRSGVFQGIGRAIQGLIKAQGIGQWGGQQGLANELSPNEIMKLLRKGRRGHERLRGFQSSFGEESTGPTPFGMFSQMGGFGGAVVDAEGMRRRRLTQNTLAEQPGARYSGAANRTWEY